MGNEKAYTGRKSSYFNTIAISKILFQSFITTLPKHIVNELEKIQNTFFWNNSSAKIKREILCNNYEAGGLKNVDIPNKTMALQCSCLRRLYDNSFHEWKLIPQHLIEKPLGALFLFHSNLLFKSNKTMFLSSFYRENILNWEIVLLRSPRYFLPFCHNIYSTMEVSKWSMPLFIF